MCKFTRAPENMQTPEEQPDRARSKWILKYQSLVKWKQVMVVDMGVRLVPFFLCIPNKGTPALVTHVTSRRTTALTFPMQIFEAGGPLIP